MSHHHDDHDDDAAPEVDLGDGTLGGYLALHSRPPAFEGSDGHPYTVSIEVERTSNLRAPWLAYLVFPRWAATGLGVVGHVESPPLWDARGREEAIALAGATSLLEVKGILEEAILRRAEDLP